MSRPFTSSLAKSLYSTPRQSTPGTQTSGPVKTSPATPTARYPSPLPTTPLSIEQTPTGKWSHPAVSKITLLQSQKAPNDTTLKRIFYNIAAVFVLFKALPYIYPLIESQGATIIKYTNWTIYTLFILLSYNIIENSRRFWWQNTYDDPTLTAKQRNLLNLPASPAATQAGKVAAAITPPRYQKTFTPSPSSQSPLAGRRNSYSSYSPSTQTSTSLSRNSPLQLAASPNRSVSMLSSAAPQSLAALSNSIQAQHSSDPSPKSEFQSSTRWRYNQTVTRAQM